MNKHTVILIVDDDEDDRDIFFDAVKEIDPSIKCIKAGNGQEALELLKSLEPAERPHYIFLDLNMPKLNGKQCLCEIKKQKALNNIPVIMYSTTNRKQDVEETMQLGASQFITKPTLYTEIRNVIASVLGLAGAVPN